MVTIPIVHTYASVGVCTYIYIYIYTTNMRSIAFYLVILGIYDTHWYSVLTAHTNAPPRVCVCVQELTVTDDTVLEEHCEDPCLLQIRLLGEGGE